MFIDNKYHRWYFSIINNAKIRATPNGYSENHHILPKSMGGTWAKKNIVSLTAREHFICHLLLTKMTSGIAKQKMFWALKRLVPNRTTEKRYSPRSSKIYEMAKLSGSEKVKDLQAEISKKQSVAMKEWYKNNPEKAGAKRIQQCLGHQMRTSENKIISAKNQSAIRTNWWSKLKQDAIAYKKHCETNRKAQLGKKLSDEHKAILKMRSEESGARYVVESPCGEISKPPNFAEFCRNNGLSHQTIKQAYHFGKGDKRVQKGPSIGWRILEIKK